MLSRIVARNRPDLLERQRHCSLATLREQAAAAPAPRPYRAALAAPGLRFIAEIKRTSPSKGLLRPDLDVVAVARSFEAHGADCISVLTERFFFDGELAHVTACRAAVSVPLLRKDFLFDPYHLYEARASGADAVLLIVAMLDQPLLRDLLALATDLGLAVQVEVHDEDECDRAFAAGADLIGVNNRDLRDFTVSLATTERLIRSIPAGVVTVSESGIQTPEDIGRLAACGVNAVHIGERLMRDHDPGVALGTLISASRGVAAP